jgi:hypothetical protein
MIMLHTPKNLLLIGGILAVAAAGVAMPAAATENGLTNFPIGVDTQLPALVPAVGATEWLNYNQVYQSNRQTDSQGHKAPIDFKVTAEAEAAKILHTWINFSGIDIASAIVQPFVNTSISVGAPVPHVGTLIVEEGSTFGLGDTDLVPLVLHANVGNGLHLALGTNVWVPTGTYSKTDPASPGLNRDTYVGQQFITTWLPNAKTNVSTSTIIEFGSTNPATHYYSGAYVNTDFHAGYRFFDSIPKLELGVQGFYMKQFENDTQNGAAVNGDGHKGQAVAFGPQIGYDAWEHGGILFKLQKEFDVENRAAGTKIWIQFAIPLGH